MTSMQDREWASVALVLDEGWPADFTKDAEAVYFLVLRRFPVAVVADAVGNLAAAGAKFRPSVGEVAAECNRLLGNQAPGEFDAPAWVEVLPVADRAAYRWMRSAKEGTAFVREQLGEVAAAWFANGGRQQILDTAPTNYGFVGKGYDAFVAVQRDRVAKGLRVTTADGHGGLPGVSAVDLLGAGE